MSDIVLAEYTLKRALREHSSDLVPTSSPHILCTPLPKHWRSNKSLPNQFRVVSLINVSDGTRVLVTAGNEERHCAELKNPIAVMHANEARFSDLRFLGRSGRGKSFNITINIEVTPPIAGVYMRAIKVTVDGPRVPRNKYSTMRAVKLQRDNRRMEQRHTYNPELNRIGRHTSSRGVSSYPDEQDKNTSRRSTISSREHFRSCKEMVNSKPRFHNSAFGPINQSLTTDVQLRERSSPDQKSMSTFGMKQNQSVCEKSPSSSENSLPSLGTENKVPLSPFESSYILSSINEAYARLLARQMQNANENNHTRRPNRTEHGENQTLSDFVSKETYNLGEKRVPSCGLETELESPVKRLPSTSNLSHGEMKFCSTFQSPLLKSPSMPHPGSNTYPPSIVTPTQQNNPSGVSTKIPPWPVGGSNMYGQTPNHILPPTAFTSSTCTPSALTKYHSNLPNRLASSQYDTTKFPSGIYNSLFYSALGSVFSHLMRQTDRTTHMHEEPKPQNPLINYEAAQSSTVDVLNLTRTNGISVHSENSIASSHPKSNATSILSVEKLLGAKVPQQTQQGIHPASQACWPRAEHHKTQDSRFSLPFVGLGHLLPGAQ